MTFLLSALCGGGGGSAVIKVGRAVIRVWSLKPISLSYKSSIGCMVSDHN